MTEPWAFFEEIAPNKKNKISSDMRSVPDLKNYARRCFVHEWQLLDGRKTSAVLRSRFV